jgi:hypothetical protein
LDEENRGLKKARNLALVAERIEGWKVAKRARAQMGCWGIPIQRDTKATVRSSTRAANRSVTLASADTYKSKNAINKVTHFHSQL